MITKLWISLVAFLFFIGCVAIAYNSMTVMPNDIGTMSQMNKLEHAIKKYYKQNKTLPDSLQNLIESNTIERKDCNDMWGNKFEYIVSENKDMVKLVSHGPSSLKHTPKYSYTISYTFKLHE